MQKSNDDKSIAAPVVDVSDQLSEKNMALEVKDGFIGLAWKRLINEFEQHSRPDQHCYQYDGHAAKTPCERESERAFRNPAGPEM